jgi:hypothetical protein
MLDFSLRAAFPIRRGIGWLELRHIEATCSTE